MYSPIGNVIPCSFLDWPSYISYVIFLRGCNWACRFCQNHPLAQEGWDGFFGSNFVLNGIRGMRSFIDSLVISGGEPLLHVDFLESFCREVKLLGILIKLDTNGSEPYALERLLSLGLIDFVSMDIKAPLEAEGYSKITGVFQDRSRLSLVKDSMRLLDRYKVPHVYRTTVVKALHSREDILSIACDIGGTEEYHLQDFDDRDPLDPSLIGTGGYGGKELESWIPEIKRYVKKVLILARH